MNAFKSLRKSLWRLIPAGLLIWIAAFFLVNCSAKDPIRVGFAAQLTGVQSELGVQERNGVQMAMEEINATGGIAGRPIELIVQDDLGTPEGARAADNELIKADVVAIIGHATSAQTMAGLPVINAAHVVMLSPTATTPELSGRDDYFFRISYSLKDRALAMAQHIYQGRHITRIAVICDTDNTAYSKAFQQAFTDEFKSLGGQLTGVADFSSKSQPDLIPLVAQLRLGKPDGLLIIAADIDTAFIAQRTRMMGWRIPLFTSAWAQTQTLISNGGQAVEGMEIEIANTFNDQAPGYLDFKARYQTKYGRAPSFGAALGYEAAGVLAAALEKTGGKAEGLGHALVSINNFNGLSSTFSFNRYGDVKRSFYIGTIRDGKYVDIEPFKVTKP